MKTFFKIVFLLIILAIAIQFGYDQWNGREKHYSLSGEYHKLSFDSEITQKAMVLLKCDKSAPQKMTDFIKEKMRETSKYDKMLQMHSQEMLDTLVLPLLFYTFVDMEMDPTIDKVNNRFSIQVKFFHNFNESHVLNYFPSDEEDLSQLINILVDYSKHRNELEHLNAQLKENSNENTKNKYEKVAKQYISSYYTLISQNRINIIYKYEEEFLKQAIEIDQQNLFAYRLLMKTYQEKKEFMEVKLLSEKLIENFPNHWLGYNNLGSYYKLVSKDYQKAYKFLKKAYELDPENPKPASAYAGSLLSFKKDTLNALQIIDKFVEADTDFGNIYLILADILMNRGEHRKAELLAKKAQFLDHDKAWAFAILGMINQERGNYSSSISLFEDAARNADHDDQKCAMYSMIALNYLMLENEESAIMYFRKAARMGDPASINILNEHGIKY
jgi:tetratricopeptide (TPR) repeat protein